MRLLGRTSLLVTLVVLMGSSVAHANCDNAERLRLEEEMRKLAARNAWSGVERSYSNLENLAGCELPFDDHFLGAQSARYLGKVYEMYERLQRAKDLDPQEEILDNLAGIDSNYGRIRIRGSERRPPELSREAMPFAPDQRKAIEWAQLVVSETGRFDGMLPAGDYVVGETAFSVAAGQDWVEIEAGKGSADSGEGLIVYAGPVATIGAQFLSSPAPKDPVLDGEGAHQFAPESLGVGSGFRISAGAEVGFTKEFGVAATVAWTPTFGTHSYHGVSGWLAAAVRPGNLRIAAGPTYTVYTAQGTGVAEWFDIDHDQRQDPNDGIPYQGFAYGGGAALSVGYGFLDLNPLQGVVEIGGAFDTDGSRSYFTFGLRVGIVPLIERFKG